MLEVGREAIVRVTVQIEVSGTLKPSELGTKILRDEHESLPRKQMITGTSQTYTEPQVSQKMRSTYVQQRDLHKCNNSLVHTR
jgi:hypothetical protein